MNKKNIAKLVKRTLKEKNISYYRLLKDIQIQQKQIMDIENCANYRVDTLCRVLEYLHISLEAIALAA